MSAENKALVRRLIEEVWNRHNLAAAEQMLSEDYTAYDPATPGAIAGMEGFRQFFNTYTSAFPDQHFTVEDIIAEGDRVVTQWSVEGTHTGTLSGIAPTGKRIRVGGITISRIDNGRIAEDHIIWDALGLMQQIGGIQKSAKA